MSLKRLIPNAVKIKIRVLQRLFNDRMNGTDLLFAKYHEKPIDFAYFIQLEQEIKQTYQFENKLSNIKISCLRINDITVLPGQILSFWGIVGAPSLQNGFKTGRNIISGKLSEAIGGGLCQTSSIVYHLSLIAGLEIIERYNHTIDIYTEETRFTPLGADATVVFGYKDLRIRNNYDFPIKFFLEIKGNHLIAKLLSQEKIVEKPVFFNKIETSDFTEIQTTDVFGADLARSYYRKPQTG